MKRIFDRTEKEKEAYRIVWNAWKKYPPQNQSDPFRVSDFYRNKLNHGNKKPLTREEFEKYSRELMDYGLFSLRDDRKGWKRESWDSINDFIYREQEKYYEKIRQEGREREAIEVQERMVKAHEDLIAAQEGMTSAYKELSKKHSQVMGGLSKTNDKIANAHADSQKALKELGKIQDKQVSNEVRITQIADGLSGNDKTVLGIQSSQSAIAERIANIVDMQARTGLQLSGIQKEQNSIQVEQSKIQGEQTKLAGRLTSLEDNPPKWPKIVGWGGLVLTVINVVFIILTYNMAQQTKSDSGKNTTGENTENSTDESKNPIEEKDQNTLPLLGPEIVSEPDPVPLDSDTTQKTKGDSTEE